MFDAAYNDVALFRNATCSGVATWWGGTLAAANDGVIVWDEVNGAMFHAPGCNASDFYQVDLGGDVNVVAVQFWGRPTWTARNAGIVISLVDGDGHTLASAPPLTGTADVQLVTFTPVPTPSASVTPTATTASGTASRSGTPGGTGTPTGTPTHTLGASASTTSTASVAPSPSTTPLSPLPVGASLSTAASNVLNFIEVSGCHDIAGCPQAVLTRTARHRHLPYS